MSGGQNLAGAIYGQITSTAVVIALSEYDDYETSDILVGVVLTMLTLWAAHAYAEVMSRQLAHPSALPWHEVRAAMAHEWPLVQAAAPAVVALGIGSTGLIGYEATLDLAIGLGVLSLLAWGFVIARRQRLSWAMTLGVVAVNGAFGLALILMSVLVH